MSVELTNADSSVDVVYTWVNNSDPAWIRMYQEACGVEVSSGQTHRTANNVARFQNRNELLYSIKSLRLYAPWVRRIFVVTNCALPEILENDEQVRRVPHEEIFPDSGVLPVFNSRAIESSLHNIEGLAEKFLYLNDDFFLCQPTTAEDFYTPDGKAYLFPSSTPIPHGKTEKLSPVEHGQLNASKLLIRDFGLTPDMKLHHAPYPMLKSTLMEIEARYPDLIATTRSHKFRDSTDIPMATTMHAYYSLANGYGEIKNIKSRYVDIGDPLFLLLINPLSPLRRGKYMTFCLNETAGVRRLAGWRDAIVDRFLKTMLGDWDEIRV
jgi:Stealth protein CR2, conserved region 2/Stealth protein CR3, conserved region 3/Stealth protein CR1, conserved region 1